MFDLDELRSSTINPKVAKEAYVQAEKRLVDLLDTKKSVEQKASSFFSAYLTVALTLFGIGGAIFKDHGLSAKTAPFFLAGTVFVVGALVFMFVLKDEKYGFLGSPPSMWLTQGTIDGADNALDAMYAYLAFYHAERIAVSAKSNATKVAYVRWGMIIGVVATVAFAIAFIAIGRA
jgi:hypothetical protein